MIFKLSNKMPSYRPTLVEAMKSVHTYKVVDHYGFIVKYYLYNGDIEKYLKSQEFKNSIELFDDEEDAKYVAEKQFEEIPYTLSRNNVKLISAQKGNDYKGEEPTITIEATEDDMFNFISDLCETTGYGIGWDEEDEGYIELIESKLTESKVRKFDKVWEEDKVTFKDGYTIKIGDKYQGYEVTELDPYTNSVVLEGSDYSADEFRSWMEEEAHDQMDESLDNDEDLLDLSDEDANFWADEREKSKQYELDRQNYEDEVNSETEDEWDDWDDELEIDDMYHDYSEDELEDLGVFDNLDYPGKHELTLDDLEEEDLKVASTSKGSMLKEIQEKVQFVEKEQKEEKINETEAANIEVNADEVDDIEDIELT